MSRVFEFGDGGEKSYLDARGGRSPAIWERKDLNYALGKYESMFGKTKMLTLVREVTGAMSPSNVPTYMFGRLIALVATAMSLRPDRVSFINAPLPLFVRKAIPHRKRSPDELA